MYNIYNSRNIPAFRYYIQDQNKDPMIKVYLKFSELVICLCI